MHTVHENQMAFDAQKLGFPSILGCQAICFQTSRGLYGFHDLKSSPRGTLNSTQISAEKLRLFAEWVRAEFKAGEAGVALYGVINRDEQYKPDPAGNAEWKSVLLGLVGADALNFTGDVLGARINSHLEKKSSTEDKSAYVEFELAGGICAVGFKRWSKMTTDTHNKEAPADQKRIIPDGLGFKSDALYKSGLVEPVVRKDDTKGFNLNRIAMKTFMKFQ